MITEQDKQFYFYNWKYRKLGPYVSVEDLHEAIHNEAERLRNELQQEGTGPLRES